ncbi:uncharacterized protein LOC108622642 isoform X2 [Ceratina calcarata]|uniref:Uncharacterized protein LOC108622642 isoform X2 n=1 Tax=Ceratina calcarata TaxID=156304 RepID=A0AAJ7WB79_9HYME|nr:uncharacterized protein LOC108622642 isoform X2 [Ceratina calcarata]XP_026669721.1 uncharacterized protein LOC108622642 isoform X2 [Ceratina calcarata]XP_026669755.1 uncharacterized protein LOC108622642 isoform X2 [Ceratina calcarata]XP_026669789.1 uncharacterized protein LOC108622642 isoform X2 [Ceratina calcarata]
MNIENVLKAFQCAQFIELTINKAYEVGKETVLENNLQKHWLKEGRSDFYKCSEFRKACDKLLEIYLKDTNVSIDVVDELFKLYVQHCGTDRLNDFVKQILINGICTNIIVGSLEKLDCIRKVLNDGFHSKLVHVAVNLQSSSNVKRLIITALSSRLMSNDVNVCLALINLKKAPLFKLMLNNSELYTYFLDCLFYFARNMKQVDNQWISKCEFEYEHLVKTIEVLLDGPPEISKITHNRMQIVKTQSGGTIWRKIENDIR